LNSCSEIDLIVIAKPLSIPKAEQEKHNTELNKITKVLNDFNINEISKKVRFCSCKRIIKPFELVMSLITALVNNFISTVTDLHRYFVKLTETDVQHKPFHNQLSKPQFSLLINHWLMSH